MPNKVNNLEILNYLEKDRIQTASVIAGEIFHRVKSPLTLIKGRAEALKAQLDYYQKDNAQGILDQVNQLEDLIASMEDFIRLSDGSSETVNIFNLVEDLILFFQFRLSLAHIETTNLIPQDLVISAKKGQLKQLLLSLFLNAVEALENSKKDIKSIFIHYQKSGSDHMITIEDSGPGITQSVLKSLFRPFLTTKTNHVGLSLAICKKIAHQEGWNLKVVSKEGKGTQVDIRIPSAESSE